MSKTAPTARAAIAALEREGWLTEVTGRNWGKLYVAKELMALLEKPDADLRAPQVA